jgi:hypothetical protein
MVEPTALDNTDKRDEIIREQKTSFPSNSTLGRLALSKNICRFELPIDMKQFESILYHSSPYNRKQSYACLFA